MARIGEPFEKPAATAGLISNISGHDAGPRSLRSATAQREIGAEQQQGLASRIADPLTAARAEQEAALGRLDEEGRKRVEATLDHTKVWVEPTLAEEHAATIDPDVQQEEIPRRRGRGSQEPTDQEWWAAETERVERAMKEAQQRAGALEAARQRDEGMRRSGR